MTNEAQIIVPVVFSMAGFLLTFVMRKVFGAIVLLILGYALFLLLMHLQVIPGLALHNDFTGTLQTLGDKVMAILKHLLKSASTTSIALFIMGGVLGVVTSKGV